MSKTRAETYVQVPHAIEAEPFYGDNDLLATWVRLFLAADTAYPFLPALPRIKQKVIDALVNAGRIELAPNDRYSIPGLAEKRAFFANAGKDGGRSSVAGSVRGPDGRFYPRLALQPITNPGLDMAWSNEPSNADADAETDAETEESKQKLVRSSLGTATDFSDGEEGHDRLSAAPPDTEGQPENLDREVAKPGVHPQHPAESHRGDGGKAAKISPEQALEWALRDFPPSAETPQPKPRLTEDGPR